MINKQESTTFSLACPQPTHSDCSLLLSLSETKIQRLEEPNDVKQFMILWNSFMYRHNVRQMKVLLGLSPNKMKTIVSAFMLEMKDELTPQLKNVCRLHLLTLYEYKQLSLQSLMCCLADLNTVVPS